MDKHVQYTFKGFRQRTSSYVVAFLKCQDYLLTFWEIINEDKDALHYDGDPSHDGFKITIEGPVSEVIRLGYTKKWNCESCFNALISVLQLYI